MTSRRDRATCSRSASRVTRRRSNARRYVTTNTRFIESGRSTRPRPRQGRRHRRLGRAFCRRDRIVDDRGPRRSCLGRHLPALRGGDRKIEQATAEGDLDELEELEVEPCPESSPKSAEYSPWPTTLRASARSVAGRSRPAASRRTVAKRRKSSRERHRTQANETATVPLRSRSGRPEPFVETDAIRSLCDRIDGWLEADQPVHLIGPTGCGKTALALSAAAERGRPVVWLNGDEAVDTAALVGSHTGGERYEKNDQFVSGVSKKTEIVRERWVDNPLSVVAVREGATLVYNEFSRSDPAAHNVLLSVFEEGVVRAAGQTRRRSDDRRPP